MDMQNLLSIVSIVISTVLSVGAIILTLWFYKESTKQNKETAIMQTDIKNAIEKLEQLYNRTYTDTFGVLKTQMDSMQKHIFSSSVGNTNTSEPNQLRFAVLGCISDKKCLSKDELIKHLSNYKNTEITEMIYTFHKEQIINFDGTTIQYLKESNNIKVGSVEGNL